MRVYWFVIVTMSTVGYGDITPKTIPGRFFAFLLSVWGVFLISLVVLLFFDLIQLTDSELMALKVYDRMNVREDMRKEAAAVIGKIAYINGLYKKGNKSAIKKHAADFKQTIQRFHEKNQ